MNTTAIYTQVFDGKHVEAIDRLKPGLDEAARCQGVADLPHLETAEKDLSQVVESTPPDESQSDLFKPAAR